ADRGGGPKRRAQWRVGCRARPLAEPGQAGPSAVAGAQVGSFSYLTPSPSPNSVDHRLGVLVLTPTPHRQGFTLRRQNWADLRAAPTGSSRRRGGSQSHPASPTINRVGESTLRARCKIVID